MNKLQVINKNRSPKETTVYYDITNTVSNVCDKIRDQYQFGPDVQFFLSNIKGLDQDVSQTELQGNDPMQKYYPNGGQVSLEQDENPKNSEQGQGNFIIRGNRATDEAQQKNIIAIESKKFHAAVVDNVASNKAKQNNLVQEGRLGKAALASLFK